MSDAPRKPRPRFGWQGQALSMPDDYYIDFSYAKMPYPHGDDWKWQFNIPPGGTSGIREKGIKLAVWNLQRTHGCANVASGNSAPVGPNFIGVYVGPHEGKHRTEMGYGGYKPMCRCFG